MSLFAPRKDLRWYEALPFILALGLQQTLMPEAHRIQAILVIALSASLYYLLIARSGAALAIAAAFACIVTYTLAF